MWLIVCPSALVALVVFQVSRLADAGHDVLPGTLVGAAMGAALILFLYGNDRPNPQTMATARWQWGLTAIPVAVVLSGRASLELIFLGFLAGFLTLFVIIVGTNMARDHAKSSWNL